MRTLIRICAERPVAVIMALTAVLIAAAFASSDLPLERLPAMAVPRVVVEAPFPGMGAAEVRSLVTVPLEDALASVKGARSLRSLSRDALASLVLEFAWGEDPDASSSRVREAIDAVYPSLPEGAEKPVALPFEADGEPLMVVSITARNGDLSLARRLAGYDLRARFRRVEGIGRVSIAGGVEREALVEVDLRRAASRGLTAADVADAVARECSDVSAGTAAEGDTELVVVASGRPSSVEALAALTVSGSGGFFKLSDIAAVRERDARRKSVFVSDGIERVCVELFRRPGADPVAAAKRARAEAERAASDFSRDFDIRVLSDSSLPVAAGIRNLAVSAVLGAIAAAAVLAFFLRDLRSSVLIAMTIPLSAAASVAVLALAGKSINGMSLGGIALGVGLISDNAVVVLNALTSAFSAAPRRPGPRAVSRAASSVSGSTLASTLTTVVVFVPVLFLPGPIGALFSDLAVSLIAAIVAGWAAALFALPSLYRAFWKRAKAERAMSLERLYRKPLAAAFRAPVFVVGLSLGFSALGTALLLSRPVAFLPAGSADELVVTADFPPGAAPERIAREGAALSLALMDSSAAASVFGRAGAEKDDSQRRSDVEYRRERLALRCPLREGVSAARAERTLRSAASAVVSADVLISVSPPADPSAVVLGLTGTSRLAVSGADQEDALRRAENVLERLRSEGGTLLASSRIQNAGSRAEARLVPDRDQAALRGASFAELASVLKAATEGGIVGRLETDGRGLDVRVRGARMAPGVRDSIALVPVSSGTFAAASLAKVSIVEERAAAARKDRSDTVYVEAAAVPGGERELARIFDSIISSVPGVERDDANAFRRYGAALAVTVCLALALLYLTLGAQFESFVLPLIMLTTIPLALAGAGPALIASGAGLDSGSVLGLVVLFGTAVNNAIILFETNEEKARNGVGGTVAAYSGAIERVRPVLVTALTTVVALIPVVLSPGASTQRSMSAAMLGGFVASTALTLFVSPLLFSRFLRGRGCRKGERR